MSQRASDRTMAIPRADIEGVRFRKAHASLVVLQGAEIGRDFLLRRRTTVLGRGPEADIRLPDDLASREHARVEVRWDRGKRNASFHLTDLGSTNGTLVNNRLVESTELRENDKIQIGMTVLKFDLLDEVEARFHEEIRNRISYDQLTGLLTRESLYLALESELQRSRKYRTPLAVLMMDLDHFKSVNDTHGHLMGSHVLSEVGRLIRGSIREDDVSARYGGEEFLAYLPERGADEALQAAERIRRAIESASIELDGVKVGVTISIGIATFPDHGEDIKSLVGRADQALYRAKRAGRNLVRL
ncbi:MAG TPA: GGDEF domain-containing protein [Candidatus Polarisedimenticolia bacterium]|jgi:diguanylate cyclase (GGDEF)-like protein|nr:GGDEF domain-containing protein [Candidatus Polarisedimenticolia bacterium]